LTLQQFPLIVQHMGKLGTHRPPRNRSRRGAACLALLFAVQAISLTTGLDSVAAGPAETPLIAIVDSGIEATHSQFAPGQVVAWHDFVDGRPEPFDDRGHGTAVASRAAGLTLGAYPGARLAVARVLDIDDIEAGIRWAADEGAAVINVSQGIGPLAQTLIMGADPNGEIRTTAAAVHYARTKGSLVVWSAGNEGQITRPAGLSVPNPQPATMNWGASSPEGLVVGSQAAGGSPDGYSQSFPEVTARGSAVQVAGLNNTVGIGSGTSFAAPWMSGAAARLIAAGAPRDVDWLKWVILHEANDNPEVAYPREGYGWFEAESLARALGVAAGRRQIPAADDRDDWHGTMMTFASVYTGQPTAGTTRPA
jgi:hypothetical protein